MLFFFASTKPCNNSFFFLEAIVSSPEYSKTKEKDIESRIQDWLKKAPGKIPDPDGSRARAREEKREEKRRQREEEAKQGKSSQKRKRPETVESSSSSETETD